MAGLSANNARASGRDTSAAAGRAFDPIQWLWPVLIAGMIFLASSRSNVASPGITQIDDKFGHFGVYGLLATLICRLGQGRRAALWAVLVVSAYGASDEWHQSYVPGRSSDVRDWIADTLGAILAVSLYTGWGWYRRMLEYPLNQRRRRIDQS